MTVNWQYARRLITGRKHEARRQVWFVQKDEYGASELYLLHDFVDTRQSGLLMKKYLLEVFGAVRRLGQADEHE